MTAIGYEYQYCYPNGGPGRILAWIEKREREDRRARRHARLCKIGRRIRSLAIAGLIVGTLFVVAFGHYL